MLPAAFGQFGDHRELGTRHRAALGMSEMSDAVVVVVSEETGLITVCRNGDWSAVFPPGAWKNC
jgi:DNA integrity scanning protein DisA with diadenylate cyclase activity